MSDSSLNSTTSTLPDKLLTVAEVAEMTGYSYEMGTHRVPVGCSESFPDRRPGRAGQNPQLSSVGMDWPQPSSQHRKSRRHRLVDRRVL